MDNRPTEIVRPSNLDVNFERVRRMGRMDCFSIGSREHVLQYDTSGFPGCLTGKGYV